MNVCAYVMAPRTMDPIHVTLEFDIYSIRISCIPFNEPLGAKKQNSNSTLLKNYSLSLAKHVCEAQKY